MLGVGRSVVGRSVVALDSGGFWEPGAEVGRRRDARGERHPCAHAPPALPSVLATSVGRTGLLAQLSARPWAVDRDYAVREIQGLAEAPGTSPAIRALSTGPHQEGAPAG